MNCTNTITYRIVETLDPRRPDQRWFEVWGGNTSTGYEWLIAEYDTREQAREMINQAFYGQYGWAEPSDLSYVWPVEKEQFRAVS